MKNSQLGTYYKFSNSIEFSSEPKQPAFQTIEINLKYRVVASFPFLGFQVRSSKTSRQVVRLAGKISVLKSKQCREYESNIAYLFKKQRNDFLQFVADNNLQKPLVFAVSLINSNESNSDFPNKLQTLLDLWVYHGWVPDDNMKEIKIVELPHYNVPCKTVKKKCFFCGEKIYLPTNNICPHCKNELLPGFYLLLLEPV